MRLVLDPLDPPAEAAPESDEPVGTDDADRERAFHALPAPLRVALLLRDAQGLTYAEIGQVLGFGRWVPRQVAHWMVRRLVYNARESIRLAVLHTPAAGGAPATFAMEEA